MNKLLKQREGILSTLKDWQKVAIANKQTFEFYEQKAGLWTVNFYGAKMQNVPTCALLYFCWGVMKGANNETMKQLNK